MRLKEHVPFILRLFGYTSRTLDSFCAASRQSMRHVKVLQIVLGVRMPIIFFIRLFLFIQIF